ncbi:MAG: hypothetical protein SGPRY_003547 [Prymnesium sp.]
MPSPHPQVKVAVHTAAYMGFIVLLALNVMDMGGTDGRFPSHFTSMELVFYMVSFTRFVEEIEQMVLNGIKQYINSFWNIIDFTIVMLVAVVVALRVITLPLDSDVLSLPALPYKYIIPRSCCQGDVIVLEQLQQTIRTCMSLICILVGVRLLEIFRIYRNAGVLSIILTKMLWISDFGVASNRKRSIGSEGDVLPFSGLLIVILFSFGLAFQALMPNASYESLPSSPLFIPLWASLGSIDLEHMQVYLNSYDRINSVLGPALLWIFSFTSTVVRPPPLAALSGWRWGRREGRGASERRSEGRGGEEHCGLLLRQVLVNLLIAMMADTFQKISADGQKQWQYHRIKIILEYKDERESLPPPFNVLILLNRLFLRLWRVCLRRTKVIDQGKLSGIKFRVNSQLAVMLGQQNARYRYLKQQADERSMSLEYQVETVFKEQKLLRDELKERDERNEKLLYTMMDKIERLDSQGPAGPTTMRRRSCGLAALPIVSQSPLNSTQKPLELNRLDPLKTVNESQQSARAMQACVAAAQQAAAHAQAASARMEDLLSLAQADATRQARGGGVTPETRSPAGPVMILPRSGHMLEHLEQQRSRYAFLSPVPSMIACAGSRASCNQRCESGAAAARCDGVSDASRVQQMQPHRAAPPLEFGRLQNDGHQDQLDSAN